MLIVWSAIASAAFYALAQTRLLAAEAAKAFKVGSGATAVSGSLSMLLIGVGHLVGAHRRHRDVRRAGDQLGLSRPALHLARRAIPRRDRSRRFRRRRVRRQSPVHRRRAPSASRRSGRCSRSSARSCPAFARRIAANRERKAGRGEALPITERDIPIGIVSGSILVLMIPIGLLLYSFASTDPIASNPEHHDHPQHHLHPHRRRRDRRSVRLHGRADRRIEQPDLGRRHPVGRRHRADPRGAVPARDAATRPSRSLPLPCS